MYVYILPGSECANVAIGRTYAAEKSGRKRETAAKIRRPPPKVRSECTER